MPSPIVFTTTSNTTLGENGVSIGTFTPLAGVETYKFEVIGGGGGGGGYAFDDDIGGVVGGTGSLVNTIYTGFKDTLTITLGGGGGGGAGAGGSGGAGGAGGGGTGGGGTVGGGGGGGKTTVLGSTLKIIAGGGGGGEGYSTDGFGGNGGTDPDGAGGAGGGGTTGDGGGGGGADGTGGAGGGGGADGAADTAGGAGGAGGGDDGGGGGAGYGGGGGGQAAGGGGGSSVALGTVRVGNPIYSNPTTGAGTGGAGGGTGASRLPGQAGQAGQVSIAYNTFSYPNAVYQETVGQSIIPITNTEVLGVGVEADYTYITTPALPLGLSINNRGTITGTPQTTVANQVYKISLVDIATQSITWAFVNIILNVTLPVLQSNICFPAGTKVTTDQDEVFIEMIIPGQHTINKKAIEHVTKTISTDNYLVRVEKDAFWKNIPNKTTVMTKDHKVEYRGELVPIYRLLDHVAGVKKVKYSGETLYNVLQAEYGTMMVNNLRCETLEPTSQIACLYRGVAKNNLLEKGWTKINTRWKKILGQN